MLFLRSCHPTKYWAGASPAPTVLVIRELPFQRNIFLGKGEPCPYNLNPWARLCRAPTFKPLGTTCSAPSF